MSDTPTTETQPGPWAERFPLLLRLQDVRRYSVRRTLQRQTVAEHSFNMLWIFLWLLETCGVEPSMEDVAYIVTHDLDEALTGDVPAPAKGEGARDYTDREAWPDWHLMYKLADKLEAWAYLCRERRLGSSMLDDVERSTRTVLEAIITELREGRMIPVPENVANDVAFYVYMDLPQEMHQYKEPRTDTVETGADVGGEGLE